MGPNCFLPFKKSIYYSRKHWEMISTLFGDENFWALQLSSITDMNNGLYRKIIKLRYCK